MDSAADHALGGQTSGLDVFEVGFDRTVGALGRVVAAAFVARLAAVQYIDEFPLRFNLALHGVEVFAAGDKCGLLVVQALQGHRCNLRAKQTLTVVFELRGLHGFARRLDFLVSSLVFAALEGNDGGLFRLA